MMNLCSAPSCFMFSACALLLAALTVITAVEGTFYPASDERFVYVGRWQMNQGIFRSDWPCTGVKFRITTSAPTTIGLQLKLLRIHIMVRITNEITGAVDNTTVSGNSIFDTEKTYDITIEKEGTFLVSLTKMTQAAPYGNGLGKLLTSVLDFHGVEIDDKVVSLDQGPFLPSHRINFIGASDMAGFCVNGTTNTSDATTMPWKYDDCDQASPGVLGRYLDAEISVQAIAGIGVTRNAYADQEFLLGKETMKDYYNRTLQTEPPAYNLTAWQPDLVVVSLGGNDFNHQTTVLSNETFREAYQDFLLQIIESYDSPPIIVSICGQGDPTEVERDPNNDRCRPCPHVQDATESFQHGGAQVEFIFIPCDGTVVTGVDDIGCEGHKNQIGQQRVADFLEPKLREIMGWYETVLNNEPEPIPPSSGADIVAVPWLQKFTAFRRSWYG